MRGRTLRRGRAGFSLIELMVVVMIVSVVAALAIPTMSVARFDRRTYDDAGSVMMLFRSARSRAIARGSAVLIAMTSGSSDRGTFLMYEAVQQNANASGALSPVGTCKTSWTPLSAQNQNVLLLDGVNLNGPLEVSAGITTQMSVYADAQTSTFSSGYICFTPLGRSYAATGVTTPVFDAALPTVNPLEIRVQRSGGATFRSVLVPPNGLARIFSHV